VTRILVTGAGGFIGLPTVMQLARAGDRIDALTTRSSPPQVPGVRWHRVDLADRPAVESLMHELAPERLAHIAWYAMPGSFWRAAENVEWVEHSLHLTRCFLRAGGRRVMMVGTCAEYDWSAAADPLSEPSSPLRPATLYGAAKDALRRVVGAYAEQEAVEFVWARVFFLYGPREAPGRLVSSVVQSLLAGEPVDTTSGEQVRDFMHVEDVAAALAALLESSVVGAVNVASGEPVSVSEVLAAAAAAVGRPELIRRGALPDRPGEPARLVADIARLREEVGFRPRWSLADGIADTVEWWRAQTPTPAGTGG
jgi:nucleoside-diphosphate-sugar epimerase